MRGWILIGDWANVQSIADWCNSHNYSRDWEQVNLREKDGFYYGNKIPFLVQRMYNLGRFAKKN